MTNTNTLSRRAAVKHILADRGDALTVSSLGGPSYDVAAVQVDFDGDFPLGGAMGQATMVGLGLALSQPRRRVIIFAGDGEMLMSLGSLATIGAEKPDNLAIVVIDNEHYAETGMQRTHTGRGVDIAAVAAACGFATVRTVRSLADLEEATPLIHSAPGPVFVTLKVSNEVGELFPRNRDGVWQKGQFRRALLGHV
ncbi:thiamine pyrophosphate-dependent enzyme [Sinorhizobium mexicanum]|uniref:Aldehyde dehydrogenase n=1 Tax=Sinorhizobium mexicanum TaxID=375549 RepID=A0A859QTZ0_9HYPH|nr:thiamine pyrophosphate-dependent enzyme [Sinorhizobium mexicanum]MBP1888186.1 thiamine pyrophosphate-dependent acetolactate synthase large subunit-like protein [Sinorhizobium mexicanum]QLL62969.1 aldehyde dehydrogenase [Sinorhizobium mexicanum]